MAPKSQQVPRLVRFVAALKQALYPAAEGFAASLGDRSLGAAARAVCAKTVKRDVAVLRERFGAPVAYCGSRRGFYLADPAWCFTPADLGDCLEQGGVLRVPSGAAERSLLCRAHLDGGRTVDLVAAQPAGMSLEWLGAVIVATSASAPPPAEALPVILEAWARCRRLRAHDAQAAVTRVSACDLDLHALFRSEGRWFGRTYEALRRLVASVELYQLRSPQMLGSTFERSSAVWEPLREGMVYDYAVVRDVVVRADPTAARVLRGRHWYPGQRASELPNGGLELRFPSANRPELTAWVLAFQGRVQVRTPQALRDEIHTAAVRLVSKHE